MSGRKTSAAVYAQIEEEGLLSKMRWETYRALYQVGPATAGEISQELTLRGTPGGGGRAGPGNVSARLIELKKLGVAEELGERECRVTERNVIVYDVTDQLPVGIVRRDPGVVRPKPEVMLAALIELRDLVRFARVHGYVLKLDSPLRALGKWMAAKFETEVKK